MFGNTISCRAKSAFLFILLTLAFTSITTADNLVYQLDNGMEVILKEYHNSPMVASMIFVKSGSKYESRFENGITHFLEHLLFDGTTNLSREELDGSIRNLGGYINAFTRKDLTAYLVLLPSQYINFGLTVQADMLFNSLIPDEELPKERKVVIEEINREADFPGALAEKFFLEKAYASTVYNRPVLGYKAFIENIPRDAIVDYWKRFYRPDNMTLLVIGDFEVENMKKTIETSLGSIKFSNVSAVVELGDSTTEKKSHLDLLKTVEYENNLTGQVVFDTIANVTSTYIDFSFEAPHHSDSNYLPFDLLSQYLDMDEISPLMTALKGGTDPLATEVSVSLATYEEFTRLEISIITDNPENSEKIVTTVLGQIQAVAEHIASDEAIAGIKTSVKCQNIYISEKLHYLGFMIAPMMMTTGWDFIQNYADNLYKVEWSDCQIAAKKWLNNPKYVATIVRPAGKSDQAPYQPEKMTAEEVIAHFDTVSFQKYNLDSGFVLSYPETDSVSLELTDKANYHREVLENGLTVIIKSNPGCRVFAMNIIGKDRSANEPEGKTGITDFVNRCIEKGTVTRDASELSRDLSKIGANVTLYDNPWIPYDDHYTTRRFSFMKFETIDEYAEKGFHLFSEMILHPSFDSVEVENVRRSMMGILSRNSASPSKIARNSFYETMFAGKAYAKPIMGSTETINAITVDDLKNHHRQFYSPQNMILSITTNEPIDEVQKWVLNRFGRLSSPAFKRQKATRPEPIKEINSQHTELDKEQISIYIGSSLPGANDADAVAIKVATSILSSRLYLNLREKQGLAYSVGANAVFDKDFGWFYTVIGTASENYKEAIDGITLQIEKLKLDGPTPAEVNKAKNQLWGRLMSSKLSSINQAYYLSLDEYLGRRPGYDKEFLSALSEVSVETIRRAASKYFRTDVYILATAGKIL